MSSDIPAGLFERVPAALIAEGDSLATLRRVCKALPALSEAAGKYAPFAAAIVADGEWESHRDASLTVPLLAPAVAYADALALAEHCKREIRRAAHAADLARVHDVAEAVAARSFRWDHSAQLPESAEAERDIADAEARVDEADMTWERRHARAAELSDIRGESENVAPWICLYSLERCDGGPEEGGWAYDWLEPIACWRTLDYSDPRDARGAAVAYARERGLILQGDEGARPASSVCPHNRVNAIIQPAPFPFADASTSRPRYE